MSGLSGSVARQRWFRIPHPRPAARIRLICLPHAGGGAGAYRSWPASLSPGVELVAVQPPGREDRLDEPPPASLEALAAALAAAMPSVGDRPYVLFGHSMGAAVAYETCLALRRQGLTPPVHLVVSGREAPGRERGGNVHRGGDAALRAELRRLGLTPPELIDNPDWWAMARPILHHDYRLIETYRPAEAAPLAIPITAFVGERDPELAPGDSEAWAARTSAGFALHRFPGDHFYLIGQRHGVIRALQSLLDAASGHPARSPTFP